MTPRGDTGKGRGAALPTGTYTPTPLLAGTVVQFYGEDGRSCTFDISTLPLPGWHDALAASWASRVGPSGSIRTRASATVAWGCVRRMMQIYAKMLRPPLTPRDLTEEHVDAYLRLRIEATTSTTARGDSRSAVRTLDLDPLASMIAPEVRDRLRPKGPSRASSVPGYSDGELRRIVAAARSDVLMLRERLRAQTTTADEPEDRNRLHTARNTGTVPLAGVPISRVQKTAGSIARRLFVTLEDLTPMLVLLVATTGWNVEVVKELPTNHRLIENRAVEVTVTKRRRGPGRWHQTATWELDPPGKELTTPGSVYLLLLELMGTARTLCEDSPFWAIWNRPGRQGQGCRNAFGRVLNTNLRSHNWIKAHGLLADPAREGADGDPLRLDFNRLKTSIDVRRTRQMGGHLPSAARSNTTAVLFSNYLSGDPSTIDWARNTMAETVSDVERSAWDAHRRALKAHGKTALHIETHVDRTGESQLADDAETAWARCANLDEHPSTGRICTASFLDCFQCGNCVITDDHLPQLLSLLDALEQRRTQMTDEAWWVRYGTTWVALRHEVLPSFSEAEVSKASQDKSDDGLLDLVEPRWEHP